MASSVAHRAKVRRAERAVLLHGGSINLVPLVDVLTSIVFFSLLTYTGDQMLTLTAYDLSLPPQVVTAPNPSTATPEKDLVNLLLAVRVEDDGFLVEHSEENGFRQQIRGTSEESLGQLQALLSQIRTKYPQNADVLVVPADAVSYDKVIRVLEQARIAKFTGISLGSKARSTQVSSAGGRTR